MRWLQKKFSLSERGTIEFAFSCLACAFQDFALMLPVGLAYSFIMLMNILSVAGFNMENSNAVFYLGGCIVLVMLMLLSSWLQYNATYFAASHEAAYRRLSLSEKLRKKSSKNIVSLMIDDCAALETAQSHFLAPIIGAGIFIAFMSIALLVTDWRMALALLWVIPAAMIIASSPLGDLSFLVLRLGLASVILTGTVLFISGNLKASVFFLFIMTAARLYDPLEIALQNLSAYVAAKSSLKKILLEL